MKSKLLNLLTRAAESAPVVRKLPKPLKNAILYWLAPTKNAESNTVSASDSEYAERLAREREIFSDQAEVHDLPPIFHYWSNKFLRPKLERFGFSNPDEFFANYLEKAFRESESRPARFASVGCGNCDTEIRVAQLLMKRGVTDFVLECLDINEAMLERARLQASQSGVGHCIIPLQVDFNRWTPDRGSYAAIMANQSLHHVMELEKLFASVDIALAPNGRFITSDMIGRNGHMRWPEAMEIIREYWKELPEKSRWNIQLKRHEEQLEYWDCSNEGFEGIRAQDILPLLIETFDFEFFFAFGNLIDPFIDRGFGPHFDADSVSDRELIDRIEARDEHEILAGTIKPTHVMATMRKKPYAGQIQHLPTLTPEFCVRRPD